MTDVEGDSLGAPGPSPHIVRYLLSESVRRCDAAALALARPREPGSCLVTVEHDATLAIGIYAFDPPGDGPRISADSMMFMEDAFPLGQEEAMRLAGRWDKVPGAARARVADAGEALARCIEAHEAAIARYRQLLAGLARPRAGEETAEETASPEM
jgi:hypothetical protein